MTKNSNQGGGPALNLYLSFSSGLTNAAACSKLSGFLSHCGNFLRTEMANFRFTKNCTLPKESVYSNKESGEERTSIRGKWNKKKRRVATMHRCILRCLTQLGFEAFSVATTISIAWNSQPSLSLWGIPCEWRQNDLEEDSVFVLSFFFSIPVPVQVRIYEPAYVKRNVGNKIKLPYQGVTFSATGKTLHWGAFCFFLGTFLQKG